MSNHPDVLIVGGGPSGVICAITLAQEGHKVTIIDRKKKEDIGDKTCGDAIDKAALERLSDGIGIDYPSGDEVSEEIYKMSIAIGDIDNKISLEAPGFVVDRHIYGQRLLNEAINLGVKIIDQATVRELIVEKHAGKQYLVGLKYLKQGSHEIRANLFIDASGAYAVIRKKLPEQMLWGGLKRELDDEEQWPSYREIIELNEDHHWDNEIILKYDKEYPPPGYFWVFSKGPRTLNVGIGWLKSQTDLGPMKQAYLKEMEKYYPRDSYKVIRKGGGQIPFRVPFDNLVFNGGAIVGDAACMVHPVTAEGHGPALDTSWQLGKVLSSAIKNKDYSIQSLWKYNEDVFAHYGRKHAEAEIFRNMMETVSMGSLDFLFNANVFREEELDLIFSGGTLELTKTDLLGRFFKLLRRPSLLIKLLISLKRLNACKKHYPKYPSSPEFLQEWRIKRNKILNMNY